MSDVVRFETGDGSSVLVEVDEDAFGTERISRDDKGVIEASQRLDEALERTAPSINRVVEALRRLGPDAYVIEYGIKLNAEAGVVVAKTAIEGHFAVRLTWNRGAEG